VKSKKKCESSGFLKVRLLLEHCRVFDKQCTLVREVVRREGVPVRLEYTNPPPQMKHRGVQMVPGTFHLGGGEMVIRCRIGVVRHRFGPKMFGPNRSRTTPIRTEIFFKTFSLHADKSPHRAHTQKTAKNHAPQIEAPRGPHFSPRQEPPGGGFYWGGETQG
jgi:hypothetical protein